MSKIMEKKQSSIELFAIALYEKGFIKGYGNVINDLFEEHKAMHKEEIESAYSKGCANNMNDEGDFEQYYNETFGGNNE